MAVFSKPVRLHCSCYELGHCWTPHCFQATTDVAKDVFTEAFKIYGALYLVTALFKRKNWKYYVKKFLPETLRSTIFLTLNGALFISLFCVWRLLAGSYGFYDTFVCGIPTCAFTVLVEASHRRLLGCFFYLSSSFLPATFAAGTALLFERKNRRAPLAVYITNLAVETFYRMLINRKIARPIENGEVLLFSVASAVYLYLFRKKDGLPKSTFSIFKFLVGSEETPALSTKDANDNATVTAQTDAAVDAPHPTSAPRPSGPDADTGSPSTGRGRGVTAAQRLLRALLGVGWVRRAVGVAGPQWRRVEGGLKASPRHPCCPHPHGCLHYVLTGLCRMMGVGYGVQLVVRLLSSLSALRRRPGDVVRVMWGPGSLGLACCLGFYSAIFRGTNCLLRWLRQKDEAIHGALAGFLAGGSMYFYKSLTVALFCASKVVEMLYFKGIEAGKLPYIQHAEVVIYAFSCAFVFHAAVMEPHALRPSYWKWLQKVTHNKFGGMNRRLLDVFGVESSKMFPDFWPAYDPKYTAMVRPPS